MASIANWPSGRRYTLIIDITGEINISTCDSPCKQDGSGPGSMSFAHEYSALVPFYHVNNVDTQI